MTRCEVAAYFHVSPQTVAKWQAEGCPHFFAGTATIGRGRRPRFRLDLVNAWVASRSVGGGADNAGGNGEQKGVEA